MPPTQTSVINNIGKVGIRYLQKFSLRSGSTSNAFSGGLSFTEIVKVAEWTNAKTFGKLYYTLVIDNNFGKFLLTNSL